MSTIRIPTVDGALAEERKLDVTASDVSALFGVNNWKTVYGLYREKIGGAEISEFESAFLERGRDVEPIVLRKFAEKNPNWRVWKANEYLRDPDYNLGATPDAYATDPDGQLACLEIKCISGYELKRGRWTPKAPPDGVSLQALTQVLLAGTAYGLVLPFDLDAWVLMPTYRIEPYPEVENEIKRRAKAFMEAVRNGHEPGPDFARDGELIAARYLKSERKEIDLRHDNRVGEICNEFVECNRELKTIKKTRDAIIAELQMKLQGADIALVHGFDVKNTLVHRREHVVKATSFRKVSITKDSDDGDDE